jgi:hypothetical protein
MKAYDYISFRGREDKICCFGNFFSQYLLEPVLDVGCSEMYLERYVEGQYIGIDICGRPHVKFNFENGIPFKTNSVNTVVALDVLEHVDNIYYALDELFRVSKLHVMVGFPNYYEWTFRVKFLLGKSLSGKYGLPIEKPADRHKWCFSLSEAKDFLLKRGQINGFSVIADHMTYYKYNRLLPRTTMGIYSCFAPICPSLFAYNYWAVLKRRPE